MPENIPRQQVVFQESRT